MTVKEQNEQLQKISTFIKKQKERIERLKKQCDKNLNNGTFFKSTN
jgi:hypothetical protein